MTSYFYMINYVFDLRKPGGQPYAIGSSGSLRLHRPSNSVGNEKEFQELVREVHKDLREEFDDLLKTGHYIRNVMITNIQCLGESKHD